MSRSLLLLLLLGRTLPGQEIGSSIPRLLLLIAAVSATLTTFNPAVASTVLEARKPWRKKRRITSPCLIPPHFALTHPNYIACLFGMGIWELWFVGPQTLSYRTGHRRAENMQRNFWESLLEFGNVQFN